MEGVGKGRGWGRGEGGREGEGREEGQKRWRRTGEMKEDRRDGAITNTFH